MAITHATQALQFGGADSASVTAGGNQTTDVINLDDTCVAARIELKADNSTTPASDDQIYCWLLETLGDPDAEPESADEYSTAKHAILLAVLDTASEDPAIAIVDLPIPSKGLKVYFEGATAGTTNAITVSGRMLEQRVA